MNKQIILYALGFLVVVSGLLTVTIHSDIFCSIGSDNKNPDRGSLSSFTQSHASPIIKNASFVLSPDGDVRALIDLDTLDKLADDFNKARASVRLVALLSPTCPYCVAGFRAVRNILARTDDPNIKVFIIWEPMLHSDNKEEAENIAAQISDSRVIQYWDKERLTGNVWQKTLNIDGLAWDVYMLYDSGTTWENTPGNPDYWAHQLRGVTQAPRLDAEKLEERLQKLLKSNS